MSVVQGPHASSKPLVAATHSSSLFRDVLALWSFLIKDRPGKIAQLLVLIVLAAIMEMAMLAAVVPLISILMNSQLMMGTGTGMSTPTLFGVFNQLSQSQVLGIVVVVVGLSALLRVLVARVSTEYSMTIGLQLQTGYFRILLNRDYQQVVNQSSSDSVSLITQKMQMVIFNFILGVLTTLSAVVSGIGVVVVLVWFSQPIVLLTLLALAVCYVVIALFIKGRIKRYGRALKTYNPKKVQSIQEGLGGIRDVIMTGNQEHFVASYASAAQHVERANARIVFFNALPKPVLEAIGLSSIAGIAWASHLGYFSSTDLLPLLGLFALGMLRLLPYMQQIFGQWTRFVHGYPILAELTEQLDGFSSLGLCDEPPEQIEPMPFNQSITLSGVGFRYQGADDAALAGIDAHIKKGEYIGIVGPTGSGKSTLVDMLMGLLPPTEGVVSIDGVPLTSANRATWRKRVAHVPQKLFLAQGSIAENIAFGVPSGAIDQTRVEQCAQHANLHDFVDGLLQGYSTPVGEDGVRLSGGQRQRIGLARALYSDCDVLVLDEATNALDNATELAVIDELLSLDRGYTLIAIAHNLRTVARCHRVLLVGEGRAKWRD